MEEVERRMSPISVEEVTKKECFERYAKPYRERLERRKDFLRMAERYREEYIKYNIEVEWIERDIEDARKAVGDAERELEALKVRLLG